MNASNLPVFAGNSQSRLFELDRVEIALFQILINQGLPAQRSRDLDTNVTPRIELELTTEPVIVRRHLIPGITESQFLPYNTWTFKLSVSVVTNREQNGDNHFPLIGLARWNMQMNTFLTTWTPQLCPTHIMLDIREDSGTESVWNEGGLDTTEMVFSGMFAIRESAW